MDRHLELPGAVLCLLEICPTGIVQYRERIIFLNKAVDDETGNQIVATMLYLDSVNKSDLNFYINCAGGDVSLCISEARPDQLSRLCRRWRSMIA